MLSTRGLTADALGLRWLPPMTRPAIPLHLVACAAATLTGLTVLGMALAGPVLGVVAGGALALAWLVIARPRQAVALWMFAGPTLAGMISALFPGNAVALTPDRAIGLGLGLLALVGMLAGRGKPLDLIERLWLGFGGVCLVSLLMTGGSPQFFGGMRADLTFLVLGYGLPAAGYFVSRRLAGDEPGARALLWSIALVGVVLALTGVLQVGASTTVFQSDRYLATTKDRAVGTVSSPGEYGLMLIAGICATTVLTLRMGGIARATTGAVLGLMLVALVLCKTRVFLGCGMAAAVVLGWRIPALRRGLLIGGGAILAIVVVAVPFLVDMAALERRMTELGPLYNRIALSSTAANAVVHNPIVGVGFGRNSFLLNKADYLTSMLGVPTYWAMSNVGVPHCEVLHLLFMVGLVGTIPWLMIWCHSLKKAHATPRDGSLESDLAAVALACMASFLLTGLTLDTGMMYLSSLQMWVLLGVLAGMRDRRLGLA